MRRRLDLGAALVHRPPVLFLDEPTTGLDPASRSDLWVVIQELVADGTTVLLTTQYLEEADRLADLIAVIDGGQQDRRGHVGRAQGHDGRHHRRDRHDRSDQAAAQARALLAPVGSVEARPRRAHAQGQHRRGRTRRARRGPHPRTGRAGARVVHRARAHPRRRVPRASPATAPTTTDPTTDRAPRPPRRTVHSPRRASHDRHPAPRRRPRRRRRRRRCTAPPLAWAVRDSLAIARRNLISLTPPAAADRLLDHPADHLRADVHLRVRRRHPHPGRHVPTSTT